MFKGFEAMAKGFLGHDARITQVGDKLVANFNIGINKVKEQPKDYSGQDEFNSTEWINCALWGDSVEWHKENLKKGNMVIMWGAVKTREYTNKQGVLVKAINLVGNTMATIQKPGTANKQPTNQPANQPANQQSDFTEDEIPF